MIQEPLILNIETATGLCSVSLSKGEGLLLYKESVEPNSHSQKLSWLIEEIFSDYGKDIRRDLNAVAISKGPGSYTGLRIGVSSAKGLAYGLNIPLISVDTLFLIAFVSKQRYPNSCYLPMIDARRMEVYSAIYDENLNPLKAISADIVESDIYNMYHKDKKIIVAGDGAEKCRQVLNDDIYVFDENLTLNAKYMGIISSQKYKAREFEEIAYFEPYYLKDFIAKKSIIKGLY